MPRVTLIAAESKLRFPVPAWYLYVVLMGPSELGSDWLQLTVRSPAVLEDGGWRIPFLLESFPEGAGKRRGWFVLPTCQFTVTQGKSPHMLSSKWWCLFQGIFGVDLPKAGA